MKKTTKLGLKTETIRTLTAGEAKQAAGGWSYQCSERQNSCGPSGCQCSQESLCVPTQQNGCSTNVC